MPGVCLGRIFSVFCAVVGVATACGTGTSCDISAGAGGNCNVYSPAPGIAYACAGASPYLGAHVDITHTFPGRIIAVHEIANHDGHCSKPPTGTDVFRTSCGCSWGCQINGQWAIRWDTSDYCPPATNLELAAPSASTAPSAELILRRPLFTHVLAQQTAAFERDINQITIAGLTGNPTTGPIHLTDAHIGAAVATFCGPRRIRLTIDQLALATTSTHWDYKLSVVTCAGQVSVSMTESMLVAEFDVENHNGTMRFTNITAAVVIGSLDLSISGKSFGCDTAIGLFRGKLDVYLKEKIRSELPKQLQPVIAAQLDRIAAELALPIDASPEILSTSELLLRVDLLSFLTPQMPLPPAQLLGAGAPPSDVSLYVASSELNQALAQLASSGVFNRVFKIDAVPNCTNCSIVGRVALTAAPELGFSPPATLNVSVFNASLEMNLTANGAVVPVAGVISVALDASSLHVVPATNGTTAAVWFYVGISGVSCETTLPFAMDCGTVVKEALDSVAAKFNSDFRGIPLPGVSATIGMNATTLWFDASVMP